LADFDDVIHIYMWIRRSQAIAIRRSQAIESKLLKKILYLSIDP